VISITGATTPNGEAATCVEIPGLEPGAPVEFSRLPTYYNASNICADAEGKVYLYLKAGYDGKKTYFTANGQPYCAVVTDSSSASTAEKVVLQSLAIESVTVDADHVTLVVGAVPDDWLDNFPELLRVRAGETLPLPDGDDALMPADVVSVVPNGDGTATVTVPRPAGASWFFKVDSMGNAP